MFRLVVLVGCLVTATAAAQNDPATTAPAHAQGSAGVSGGSAGRAPTVSEESSSDTRTTTTAEEVGEDQTGPSPEPPPGGLYGLPPTPKAGPNLIAAPEEAIRAQPDVQDDPLFLPSVLLIGGGSAVLLASLFTGLAAHSTYKQLERDCSDDICPAGSQQKIDNGQSLAVVSTVLTGVGIAAAGTGIALLIVAANRVGEDQPGQARARLRLTSGPTPFGLGASASF